tara:strand:+ start:2819 stop:3130 length:312 start_codon:yes stop_codon:yes gene_type:complete
MKYNKLVRDKIPTIIRKSGKKFSMHTAVDKEYQQKLWEKLKEEVEEFKFVPCEEEMADILEVLEAITVFYELDPYDVETARQIKAGSRGSFKDRIILEEVIEE